MTTTDLLNDQPWPLKDVVEKLCEAAEILLHEKNYDGHGHEEIAQALDAGRKMLLDRMKSALKKLD